MSLEGKRIRDTYKGIATLNDTNTNLSTSFQTLKDGSGNSTPLKLAIDKVGIGDLTFPTTDGTTGQVLATDGLGQMYWESTSIVDWGNFPYSIIPDTAEVRDLGSEEKPFRHVYVGPGSLYVNGNRVITDDSNTLVVSTSINQNLSIKTTGTGNLELAAEGTGNLTFKSDVTIQSGFGLYSTGAHIDIGDDVDMNSRRIMNLAIPVGANDAIRKTDLDNLDIEAQLGFSPLNKAGDSMSGELDMTGNVISNVAEPIAGTDAANKNYVDNTVAGFAWKNSVKAATLANVTLNSNMVIDGVSLVEGDRVLVKNQSNAAQNGIYIVRGSTGWDRAEDADNQPGAEMGGGTAVFVEQGNQNKGTAWVVTSPAGAANLGTDPITFTQFAGSGTYTAGDGLTISGNEFSVASNVVRTTGNQTIGGVKTFTSNIVGNISGNASTATALQTVRNFSITGQVSATPVAFDGSGNAVLAVSELNASNINAGILPSARLSGSYDIDISGIAATASALETPRTIGVTGAITGTPTAFDGSMNIAIPVTDINANNISSGTLPDARLSNNVVMVDGAQSINGIKSFNTGINFGSAIVSTPTDLSKHIALYSNAYGLSITSGTLNIVSGAGAGNVDVRAGSLSLNSDPVITESVADSNYLGKTAKAVDSDKLDGLDSSQFLRSDTSDIMTGTLTVQRLEWENGVHNINNNDGYGNVAMQFGHSGGTMTHDGGAVEFQGNIDGTTQNPVSFEISVSQAGLTSGSPVVWVNSLAGNSNGDLSWGGDQIWHAGNDGSGSGLDADTLDGQHASYFLSATGKAADSNKLDNLDSTQFLRSDVADQKTGGNLRFNDNINLTLGNSDDTKIYHSGSNTHITHSGIGNLYLDMANDNSFYIRDAAYHNNLIVTAAGDVTIGRYGHAQYFSMTHSVSTRNSDTVFFSSNDNYIRKNNASGMRTSLGLDDLYLGKTAKAADSNLLDGIDSSGFLRSNASDTYSGGVLNYQVISGRTANSASGSLAPLSIYQPSTTGDAFMSFHIAGKYATYLGVDASTNDLFVGGWSGGTANHKIWHAGNDGSGSGLDADKLDGYHASDSSTANTVAIRNSSGDINARLFRSEYDTTNSSIGYIMTQVDTGSNNYIRPSTPAQVASALSEHLSSNSGGNTFNAIGSTVLAAYTFTTDTVINRNTNYSGSSLKPAGFASVYYDAHTLIENTTTALTGTWRALGWGTQYSADPDGDMYYQTFKTIITLFTRIA